MSRYNIAFFFWLAVAASIGVYFIDLTVEQIKYLQGEFAQPKGRINWVLDWPELTYTLPGIEALPAPHYQTAFDPKAIGFYNNE